MIHLSLVRSQFALIYLDREPFHDILLNLTKTTICLTITPALKDLRKFTFSKQCMQFRSFLHEKMVYEELRLL